MTDKKFTDDEIVKALELHSNKDVACLDKCPYAERHFCGSSMARDALALINRQKAELEDLREIVFMDRSEAIKNLKAEAIKEFAQRLKKKMYPYNGVDKKKYAINAYAVEQAIECIAKEMTEENK